MECNIIHITHHPHPDRVGKETTIMDFLTSLLLNLRTEVVTELTYSHTYWIFLLPLVMIAADVISGWIQATINSTWDSTKMRKGLYRKTLEMMIVVVVFIVGCALPFRLPNDMNVAFCASIYVVIMEAVSVLENLDLAGVPVPVWLVKRLKKVSESLVEGEDDQSN